MSSGIEKVAYGFDWRLRNLQQSVEMFPGLSLLVGLFIRGLFVERDQARPFWHILEEEYISKYI